MGLVSSLGKSTSAPWGSRSIQLVERLAVEGVPPVGELEAPMPGPRGPPMSTL